MNSYVLKFYAVGIANLSMAWFAWEFRSIVPGTWVAYMAGVFAIFSFVLGLMAPLMPKTAKVERQCHDCPDYAGPCPNCSLYMNSSADEIFREP